MGDGAAKTLGGRPDREVVIQRFGWRIRFYDGTSFFARPLIHRWKAYGSSGVTLRLGRGAPGPGGRRVIGVQWRPLTPPSTGSIDAREAGS